MRLHTRAVDVPALRTDTMCKITDKPVPGHRHRDAHADTPNNPASTADGAQRERQRHLMRHPAALKETIKWVTTGITKIERWRMVEL